jgi:hypothetical protein
LERVTNPTARRLKSLHDPPIASNPDLGMKHWIRRNTAMNSIKTIIVAAALFVGYLGAAQAAETIKPMQGMSFHTRSTDAVAYFTADKGKCSLVLTVTDKFAYAPTRFEEVVKPRRSTLYQVADGTALEFTCRADAQAMTIKTIDILETSFARPAPERWPSRLSYAKRYESPRESYGYKNTGYESTRERYGYKDPGYESPRERYGYKDPGYENPRERYGYNGYKDPGYESPGDRDGGKGSRHESPSDRNESEVTGEQPSTSSRVSLHTF